MRVISITQEIRQQAKQVAENRNTIAQKHERLNGKYFDKYTDLETNWQGAIAEILLQKRYPFWELAQPLTVDSTDTLATDFYCGDLKLEVKCNRFLKIHQKYFINYALYHKKKHLFDKLVCCGINNAPDKATLFYLFGWINKDTVESCDVDDSQASKCYAVPLDKVEEFP